MVSLGTLTSIKEDGKDISDTGKSKNERERRQSSLCSIAFFSLVGVKDNGHLQKLWVMRIRLNTERGAATGVWNRELIRNE